MLKKNKERIFLDASEYARDFKEEGVIKAKIPRKKEKEMLDQNFGLVFTLQSYRDGAEIFATLNPS